MKIVEKASMVVDRSGFVEFLADLRRDLSENESGWENSDLESFLEALAGIAEDRGERAVGDDGLSWREMAELMSTARIYE